MVNKPNQSVKEMVIEIVDEAAQILDSASRFVAPVANCRGRVHLLWSRSLFRQKTTVARAE
jgi:hypothetical protein